MTDDDIGFTAAAELSAAYRAKRLSPVEATRAILARIDALDPVLNCFCYRDDEAALRSARASEERWAKGAPLDPLDGVPVSIKDLIPTRGWPTLCGSKAVDPAGPWDEDDPAVARLREAGAVLIGKTTTPEFGNSGVTNSPLTGLTVNPWDTSRTPAGSSGGSVAAVASGLGPLSLGSDGGGSIRTPASFCGLVGFKPSFGRIPALGGDHFGLLSCSGPISRTVRDAALMMNVVTRPDTRDWWSLPYDGCDYAAELDSGVEGLRIAYSADLGFTPVDPEVAEIVERAALAFEGLGATVERADPGFDDPLPTFNNLWPALAAALFDELSPEQQELVGDEMRESAEIGQRVGALDYLKACAARAELGRVMAEFHQTYDLLLTPTAAFKPFDNAHEVPPEWDTSRGHIYETPAFPFNFSRQPAVTVPCGFTGEDLPVGLQIVGPLYADAGVLRAAQAYQTACPTLDRRPPVRHDGD
jgi:aspartyl-tRNA(Asn)/glutamyl-tRNA(Gln) amidotransferase subunit A